MMLQRNLFRTLVLLCVVLVGALAFAACGGDDDSGGATKTPTKSTAATKTPSAGIDISGVPELKDGKLTVGSDIEYAPIEYFVEGTQNATGLDVDLMNAMGEAMGVDVEFQQVADFAAIVQDLKTKRYDVVMSAISITVERRAEIDFVEYFGPAGTGVLVPTGNPKGITSIEGLCGLTVGAQVGTVQVDYMNEFNGKQCATNPINIKTYPDNPTAVQELGLGRLDAELADDPVAAYSAAQSTGKLVEVAATRFDSAPYGIGVRKDSPELNAALKDALQAIKDNGQYASILDKWGQSEFAQD
jgi:polar amino acid transport system substrate-binding protein